MPDCLVEVDQNGVMLIRLNRPERMNALGGTLVDEYVAAFQRANRDDRVRAVVLTGEGRAWCAGADLVGGSSGPTEYERRSSAIDPIGLPRAVLDIYHCDMPVIAAVNGAAVGAGFGMACACDIRIASEDARFSTMFINRALAPDFGLSWFLPRIVGPERAAHLFFSGRMLGAAEALDLGIVSRVVPRDELLPAAMALAESFARQPPMALTFTKRALRRSPDNSFEQQLEFEWANQKTCTSSEEFREAIAAFREKREADFTRF